MIKLDINGNTVSRNRDYLIKVIRNMPLVDFKIDSVGRVMVACGDGGSIRFFQEEEQRIMNHILNY